MERDWHAAVWLVLVEECGAAPDDWPSFALAWPRCEEYRFIGTLGFGGKVWAGLVDGAPFVSCYREDETPERLATIARANERLAALWRAVD
jgi:hypothetical protein